MCAGIHTDRSSRGEGAGTRNPAVEALFAAGRWRCFVNGCGVESTLGLALSRAGVGAATVIRNLVGAKADPLSKSAYLSPREIPIRESHFVSPPRVNVAQKRRLRKIRMLAAAAGCCMWERIPRGSAEHQWFGDCTFCAFVGAPPRGHVQRGGLLLCLGTVLRGGSSSNERQLGRGLPEPRRLVQARGPCRTLRHGARTCASGRARPCRSS